MSDHVYKLLELTGSSTVSMEEAVQKAISKAAKPFTICAGSRWLKPEAISIMAPSAIGK